jgi:hypothetical protein
MELLQNLPAAAIGPACVLGFVVPALIGLWFVHRNIHERLRVGETLIDNSVVGWFFSGVLTIYGITLGLIAITTWESTRAVADVASREAASIAALYRDTAGFASPLRDDLHAKLRGYTRFVIDQAWPAQRRGEILSESNELLNEFQQQLFSNEPQTESARLLQAEALKEYNELVEWRRQRTEAVDDGVPGVIWVVILLGAVVTIATSYCFQMQPYRLHLLLTTVLATMIGLLVFLIAALDRPYRGAVTVEPTAYEIILNGPIRENSEERPLKVVLAIAAKRFACLR